MENKSMLPYFSFFSVHSDSIWCDVIPMKVVYVLLGHPWFYNWDVHHHGEEKTYSFKFKNKKILLKSLAAAEMGKYWMKFLKER